MRKEQDKKNERRIYFWEELVNGYFQVVAYPVKMRPELGKKYIGSIKLDFEEPKQ